MFKAFLDDREFHTSLGYLGRHCLQKETGEREGEGRGAPTTWLPNNDQFPMSPGQEGPGLIHTHSPTQGGLVSTHTHTNKHSVHIQHRSFFTNTFNLQAVEQVEAEFSDILNC